MELRLWQFSICGLLRRSTTDFSEKVPAECADKGLGLVDKLIHGRAILQRQFACIVRRHARIGQCPTRIIPSAPDQAGLNIACVTFGQVFIFADKHNGISPEVLSITT